MANKGAIRVAFEAQRSLAFGSIGASYAGIGTSFDNPIRLAFIQNLTNATLQFSFDGVDDHFPLPSNGYFLMDISANKTVEEGFYIAEGDRIYVKRLDTPTQGSVYVSVLFGEDE